MREDARPPTRADFGCEGAALAGQGGRTRILRDPTWAALFDRLPKRFSRAALLKQFPRPTSLRIIEKYSPAEKAVKEVLFENGSVTLLDDQRTRLASQPAAVQSMQVIRQDLLRFFTPALGFSDIARLNYTDGVRLYFANGDIAHVRPSGNADELRIYAVADTLARAEAIAKMGIAEPDGILRRLEQAVR
jgi:phosphomannomutase